MDQKSVFELISTLCQKLLDDGVKISENITSFRSCRARAFEIILKSAGSPSNLDNPVRELDFHLFEMKLKASNAFHRDRNKQMDKILDEIEKNPFFQTEVGKTILTFLFHLRSQNPPDTYKYHQESYPFGLFSSLQSANEKNPYITVTEEMFQLPDTLPLLDIGEKSHELNPYFKSFSEELGGSFFTQNLLLAQETFSRPFDEILMPKFPDLPEDEPADEELVNGQPEREIVSLNLENYGRCSKNVRRILTLEDFLKDLRALCMGFKSPSFPYRQRKHEFCLRRHFHVENITTNTLNQLILPFVEFGTCMKRLQLLIAQNSETSQRIYEGFIFRAFCLAISQYLASVRHFISLGNDKSILEFAYRISGIVDQVTTLGRICYLSPKMQEPPEVFPSGAKLLKYLSSHLNQTMRREIFLLLANLMVKCVEFYLRHLEKWIFQGVLEDPHGELFIIFTDQYDYDTKKFFDRAYSAQKDLIPDFLQGFDENTVLCGKYTMLLKAFNPLHPLFDITKPSLKICLSDSQISSLRQEVDLYSNTASEACGPKISIEEIHRRKAEKMETLKRLVEAKRVENIQRWEIEREEAESAAIKLKQEHLQELKQQMEMAREEKEAKKREEVAQELIYIEQQRLAEEADMKRDIDERTRRIQHYKELNHLAEKKLEKMEKAKGKIEEEICNENYMKGMKKSNSDIFNANDTTSELARNRAKVLGSSNLDNRGTHPDNINLGNYENCDNKKLNVNLPEDQMTACQRNKLKVMSHEFNIDIPMDTKLSRAIEEETMTELERNRRRILYRDLNSNTESDSEINRNSLSLNFETERMRNRRRILETEFDIAIPSKEKLTPMSTTSDCSGESVEKFVTPEEESKEFYAEKIEKISEVEVFEDKFEIDGNSEVVLEEEDAVKVEEVEIELKENVFLEEIMKYKTSTFINNQESSKYPMNLTHLNAVSMKEFLRLSIAIPLEAHMSLLNGEIMKMFLEDLDILGHWQSLRKYFLLMDGEFGSQIGDGLIERLEGGIQPGELLNFHTLHAILDTALGFSLAGRDKNSNRLSFTVNSIPGKFDLLSPNVLEDLRLSYRVEWPVNLILNLETIQQYASIFQYLLKVRRMGWILENVFQHLKELSRLNKDIQTSSHYRHIQFMRHKFSHFVLTLQYHITVNALQVSWEQLMEDLKDAKSMTDLYKKHTGYIKRIRFLCMLNRHSIPFYSAIENVFKLIIRFSWILKAKAWKMGPKGGFIHPKYGKLAETEEKFDEQMRHIIQMGWKIVSQGYQMEIGEFILLLNLNGYYVAESEFK